MDNKRKDFEALIEANYQSYKLLQNQLLETNNFEASNKLREIYFEINRLRYDEGAAMIKDVYSIDY